MPYGEWGSYTQYGVTVHVYIDFTHSAYVTEADLAQLRIAIADLFAMNQGAAQKIQGNLGGIDMFITPPEHPLFIGPGAGVGWILPIPDPQNHQTWSTFPRDAAGYGFEGGSSRAVRSGDFTIGSIASRGAGIFIHEMAHMLYDTYTVWTPLPAGHPPIATNALDRYDYSPIMRLGSPASAPTKNEGFALASEMYQGYGPDPDSIGHWGHGAVDRTRMRGWLKKNLDPSTYSVLESMYGSGAPPTPGPPATPRWQWPMVRVGPSAQIPFFVPAGSVAPFVANGGGTGLGGETFGLMSRDEPSLPDGLHEPPLDLASDRDPDEGPPSARSLVAPMSPSLTSELGASSGSDSSGLSGGSAGYGGDSPSDASPRGGVAAGEAGEDYPSSDATSVGGVATGEAGAPGLEPNLSGPAQLGASDVVAPDVTLTSPDDGDLSIADLLAALYSVGQALAGWFVPFVAPPTPESPQSGPDPEDNPPEPDDSDQPEPSPPSVPPSAQAVTLDPMDGNAPLGDSAGPDPPPPGSDWSPTPKGDPPSTPGLDGIPPQWSGWGSPFPVDPPMNLITGNADPFGLGLTWDTALGAAAAIAQAFPSATAQDLAALQAYFAQNPWAAPPDWLLGAELLGSLPPGMTLEQYLQEHAQYQVPTGDTYARVPSGPIAPTGPGDPPWGPGDPLGGGGAGPGGGAGGGGGGDAGGGIPPTSGNDPDGPVGDSDPVGGYRPRPDPGPYPPY